MMNVRKLFVFVTIVCIRHTFCIIRELTDCQENFFMKPPDGLLKVHTFTWLGFVQYIHVTTGLPHHSKAPRVVLIQKQFVVATATDMLHLPKNYKLGNIIFGEYERDEQDCGLNRIEVKMGATCPRTYLEVPIADITPHPEFSRFGVGNSLALVKLLRPMKSHYMLPVCLPSLEERLRKRKNKAVFMVDYISNVPRDFDTERMGKKTLKLYTHKECRRHRMKSVKSTLSGSGMVSSELNKIRAHISSELLFNETYFLHRPKIYLLLLIEDLHLSKKLGSEGVTHVLCTSGCGVRPGAPIISQNIDGGFELIGIAAGGGPCSRRTMRRRLITEPPLYVDIFPYVTWITNIVTAHKLPKAYPNNFMLMEGGQSMSVHRGYLRQHREERSGWRARIYVSGDYCYKSLKKQQRTAFFYSEKFEVNANPPAKLNILIKISAGISTTIVCARLSMPNRLVEPIIRGVGRYNISIEFNSEWFPHTFYFGLGLSGKNTTTRNLYKWIWERKPGFE